MEIVNLKRYFFAKTKLNWEKMFSAHFERKYYKFEGKVVRIAV